MGSQATLIIPAAGSASRLRGLPKFLLPTHEDNTSLIERHLHFFWNYFGEIIIGINPDFNKLIRSVLPESEKLSIHEIRSLTMTETVKILASKSSNKCFTVLMPDTYFTNYDDILTDLECETYEFPKLFCWKIKDYQIGKLGQVLIDNQNRILDIQDKKEDCIYEFSWGMAIFNEKHLIAADLTDSHIGSMFANLMLTGHNVYATKVSGEYFDCGTQSEYIRLLLSSI